MTPSDPETGTDRISPLLNKYVAVWLWSILFGAASGIGYSVTSFRTSNWGTIGAVLILPTLFVIVLVAGSWLHLYRALTRYLLPVFFGKTDRADPGQFGYSLTRAFQFLFLASLMRIIGWLLELALGSLSRWG